MIKLLVVDDSPLMRRLLGELFEAEGDFEVVFARDGEEALQRLRETRPDVVTLDIQMPQMDGLQCLDRIMVEQPTPVVMASSLTTEGAAEAMQALQLGAVDVIAKPSGALSMKMDQFGPPLVEKVRMAAGVRLSMVQRLRDRVRARAGAPSVLKPVKPIRARPAPAEGPPAEGLVLVGSSTGGPPALDAVLAPLPGDFPWPIVIAQHMPATFTGPLAKRLDRLTALTVVEVDQPMPLQPGYAYIARGDADVIVSRRGDRLFALNAPSAPEHRWHPSVDRLVDSALGVLPGAGLVGVLLTGMGDDGAAAMGRLKHAGGHTIAEAEATAVVWGMPRVLIETDGASEVAELQDVAHSLSRAVAVR